MKDEVVSVRGPWVALLEQCDQSGFDHMLTIDQQKKSANEKSTRLSVYFIPPRQINFDLNLCLPRCKQTFISYRRNLRLILRFDLNLCLPRSKRKFISCGRNRLIFKFILICVCLEASKSLSHMAATD